MTTKENSSAHLIVEQCEQLAAMMFQDAAALPPGLKQKELLKLAQGYRNLAEMKNFLSGKVN
jgi:hypothetical protein